MLIKLEERQYWVPDELANDPNTTVAQIRQAAIPYDLWQAMDEVKRLQAALADAEAMPEYIKTVNQERAEIINQTQAALEKARLKLSQLQKFYNPESG